MLTSPIQFTELQVDEWVTDVYRKKDGKWEWARAFKFNTKIKIMRMITIKRFRELVQTFPETSEKPHFEKISFRVKEKIFATYDPVQKQACVKLTKSDQDVFSLANRNVIYPVGNKWGTQGWTIIDLQGVSSRWFEEAVRSAYCTVAPKKLAEVVKAGST